MKYYLFLLSKSESIDGNKKGFSYAKKNRGRWIEVGDKEPLVTYDRGSTHIVHEDKAYHIYKDYINFDENYRVFICVMKNLQSDDVTLEIL